MSLEEGLREYFGTGDRRVVIVGVGNPIRGDDAVGPKIIELLESKPIKNVLLLNTESVPEAFTGKVEQFNPTHVLLVDAANFRGMPGETKLITGVQIGGQAISTHSLPLNIFISYIEKSLGISVILLGIQPMSINLGEPMSEPVEEAAKKVADTINRILSK
jgi:hydrogenase 3 maturation protease